jgi:hypothetical protein
LASFDAWSRNWSNMSKAKNVPLKPAYTPPSLVVWTDERLATLDKTQLANLLENLRTQLTSGRVSEATAVDLEVRIKSRLPTPKATPRRKRSRSEVQAEARAAEQLGDLAAELARRYDLSAESAIKASTGVKGFRAEPMTDSKGLARTGASVRTGATAVERYVGYRCGDSFAGLAFVVLSGGSERPGYVLLGTDDLIGDETADNEYMPLACQHGWSATSRARMRAAAMSGFEEGAQRYEQLVARMGAVRR